MEGIRRVQVGPVDGAPLARLGVSLGERLGSPVESGAALEIDPAWLDATRGQYRADLVLERLVADRGYGPEAAGVLPRVPALTARLGLVATRHRAYHQDMAERPTPPHRLYLDWIEEQIEEHKAGLTRDELHELADQAIQKLFDSPDGQYPLTEILLRDAVDALIFEQLKLPSYRKWARMSTNVLREPLAADTPPQSEGT